MSGAASLQVEVSEVAAVTDRVKRFRLIPVDAPTLPPWAPGAHILVTLSDGSKTLRNAYSLMGSPRDRHSYQISVLRTDHSRGGSRHMHELIRAGSRLRISHPVNLFPLAHVGRKHILLAGGIGITPLLPMMEELHARQVPFELHYSVRSLDRGAYVDYLATAYDTRVHLYQTSSGARFPVERILDRQPLGTHLYVCGPELMIDAVLGAGIRAGWPSTHLHSERFLGGSAGRPFTATLARSRQTVHVEEHQSLLEAIEAAGVEAPFLCRGGSCGECETPVLGCDRELVHKDHYLNPEQRQSQTRIMICVSRANGGNIVIDL